MSSGMWMCPWGCDQVVGRESGKLSWSKGGQTQSTEGWCLLRHRVPKPSLTPCFCAGRCVLYAPRCPGETPTTAAPTSSSTSSAGTSSPTTPSWWVCSLGADSWPPHHHHAPPRLDPPAPGGPHGSLPPLTRELRARGGVVTDVMGSLEWQLCGV